MTKPMGRPIDAAGVAADKAEKEKQERERKVWEQIGVTHVTHCSLLCYS